MVKQLNTEKNFLRIRFASGNDFPLGKIFNILDMIFVTMH